MKRNAVIYSYPFAVDIVVALLLFVGRHSLASRGMPESTVGSVLLFYGLGYCVSSLFMRHIVRPHLARWQMLAALGGLILSCCLLARIEQVWLILALFCLAPCAVSLFFNSFQSYMLGVATEHARPLASTAGHYTFSWSLGYALGPFVSGASRSFMAWSHIYYLAALISGFVAVLIVLSRPAGAATDQTDRPAPSERAPGERSLIGAAWLGAVLGWMGWNAISTYWPVQAAQLGYSAREKGVVEFAYSLAQSLGALALVYAGRWHHRPLLLPALGAAGVLALLVFAGAHTPAVFTIGAVLFGLYTASTFSFMVYHSMYDADRAVKRVALNETFVGLSFLAGPVAASLLHVEGQPFGPSYGVLALLLAAGIAVQTAYAHRLRGASPDQNK
ncbi:MFS transporter [Candidatus Latescibacterota bacterium]